MSSIASPPRRPIQRLPSQLANQIAAGEVVERPASVVKELVENALDAGALHVEVDVEAGGSRLIRVRDDGAGIERGDLALALSRHATSKISGPEDLAAIESLGFRGEALASIGSVSRLRLASRAAAADCAYSLTAEGHEPAADAQPAPAAHPRGTSVEVRDLFFNTPARRRFLRTEKTEFGHIHDTLKRVALARFDVRLVLRHDQRTVADWRPAHERAGQERRVRAVFGKAFMDAAVHLQLAAAGLRAWGWAARPQFARSQSDLLYLFVNGRPVRDRLLAHAVRQAYQDSLPPGRQPALVLHLEIDPAQVDVNVHPTKHEVRFSEGRLVHDFLVRALREALDAELPPTPLARVAPASPAGGGARARGPMRRDSRAPGAVAESLSAYRMLYADPAGAPRSGPVVVADLSERFALARWRDRLWLVDLVAARTGLARADLDTALAGGARPVARPLLIPASVAAGAGEARLLGEAAEGVQALGIVVEPAGPAAVLVRALPPLLEGVAPAQVVQALCRALDGEADGRDARLVEGLAALAGAGPAPAAPLLERLGREASLWAAAARPIEMRHLCAWFDALDPVSGEMP